MAATLNPASVGEVSTYRVDYSNNSTTVTITGTTLTVDVPQGLTAQGTSGSGVISNGQIIWTLGDLSPQEIGNRFFSVVVNNGLQQGALKLLEGELSSGDGMTHARASDILIIHPDAPSFSGFVRDASTTSPMNGVVVDVGGISALTDSSGRYYIAYLPDGSHPISADPLGYQPYNSTVDTAVSTTRNFELDPDPSECTGGVLSGTVIYEATNQSIDGVVVVRVGHDSVTTASGGAFSFGSLPAGTYPIQVAHGSYKTFNQPITVCNDASGEVIPLEVEKFPPADDPDAAIISDPVNTATGDYIYHRRDIEIPGIGMPFVFERSYHSRIDSVGPLGHNWSHNWNASSSVDVDGNVTVQWGDGGKTTWASDGAGGFIPQYGIFDALIDDGGGAYTVKKKNLSTWSFNASGQLTATADRNGNTITLNHTGSNLTQITDTAGRVYTLTYDGSNRITHITDPLQPTPSTIEFDYDVNGDLVRFRDAKGYQIEYTYDSNHQILTVKNPRGFTVVTNTYDPLDRVVTHQSDAKPGGDTQYVYDPVTRMTTITDAESNVMVHYFDALQRLTREVDANGNEQVYVFDAAGNRTHVTDKNGNQTQYVYDSNGNVIEKIDAMSKSIHIYYDIKNNPIRRVDALGHTRFFRHDPANVNLIETEDELGNKTMISYVSTGPLAGTGLPEVITDARLHSTTNTYNPTEGTLITVTDYLGNQTHHTYDEVGRRTSTTDDNGHATQFVYDNNNNLEKVIDPNLDEIIHGYDVNNNRISTLDKEGNLTQFSYDEKDLLDITTDALLNTTDNDYDLIDRRTRSKDKRGYFTYFEYDPVGRLMKVKDHLLQETTTTYDPHGNRLSVTDPNNHTMIYTYDVLHRQISATDPEGNASTTSYDALGRVISTTDAEGKIMVFDYDAMGRLTQVTDAEGGTIQYGYDGNGNRNSVTDPNGYSTDYIYDELDRRIRKDEPEGGQTYYQYDGVGNLIKLTKPNGTIIDYTHDELNRLEGVTYPDTSTVTFVYDKNGNRKQMFDSLGTQDWVYDELDRVTSHTDPYGNQVGYGYDENGNRTSLTYPDLKVVNYTYDQLNRLTDVTDWLSRNTHYNYDPASRLMQATLPNGVTAQYGYDTADRLTSLENRKSDNSVISTYAYTLDKVGNQMAETRDEPLMSLLVPGVVNYSHDMDNRLTHIDGLPNSFNLNGSLTGQSGITYSWDYEDRLLSQDDGLMLTTYDYDGLSERFQRTDGGAPTRFVLDTNTSLTNVIAEVDTSNIITAYNIYGFGLIGRVEVGGSTHYHHYDSRGSTIALTDSGETVTDTYIYDPFGHQLGMTGITDNPYRYLGKHGVLRDTGVINYIRARYYDAVNARFVSKDSKPGSDGDSQSYNFYAYGSNNPISMIDISGFNPEDADKAKHARSNESDKARDHGYVDIKVIGITLCSADDGVSGYLACVDSINNDQTLENLEIWLTAAEVAGDLAVTTLGCIPGGKSAASTLKGFKLGLGAAFAIDDGSIVEYSIKNSIKIGYKKAVKGIATWSGERLLKGFGKEVLGPLVGCMNGVAIGVAGAKTKLENSVNN